MNRPLQQIFLIFMLLMNCAPLQAAEKSSSMLPLRAWRMYWGGDKEEARQILLDALSKSPGNLDATIALSFVQTLTGDETAGQQLLKSAENMATTMGEKARLAGVISVWLSDDRQALTLLKSAASLNPKDEAAYAFLGLAHYRVSRQQAGYIQYSSRDQLMAAVNAFDKSLEINPNNDMVYFYKGNALRKLENDPASLMAFQKAIQLNPDNWEARVNMASILVGQKQTADAFKELEYLEKNMPEKKEMWALYRQMFESGMEMFRY